MYFEIYREAFKGLSGRGWFVILSCFMCDWKCRFVFLVLSGPVMDQHLQGKPCEKWTHGFYGIPVKKAAFFFKMTFRNVSSAPSWTYRWNNSSLRFPLQQQQQHPMTACPSPHSFTCPPLLWMYSTDELFFWTNMKQLSVMLHNMNNNSNVFRLEAKKGDFFSF